MRMDVECKNKLNIDISLISGILLSISGWILFFLKRIQRDKDLKMYSKSNDLWQSEINSHIHVLTTFDKLLSENDINKESIINTVKDLNSQMNEFRYSLQLMTSTNDYEMLRSLGFFSDKISDNNILYIEMFSKKLERMQGEEYKIVNKRAKQMIKYYYEQKKGKQK